jgi:hypothetical protein
MWSKERSFGLDELFIAISISFNEVSQNIRSRGVLGYSLYLPNGPEPQCRKRLSHTNPPMTRKGPLVIRFIVIVEGFQFWSGRRQGKVHLYPSQDLRILYDAASECQFQ